MPVTFRLLQLQRGLGARESHLAKARIAGLLVEHPVGQDPVALGLDEYVIVLPRHEIQGAFDKSPESQIEANPGVRAAQESSRVVAAQEMRMQAFGGAIQFF